MKKLALLSLLLVGATDDETTTISVAELLRTAGTKLGVQYVYSEDLGLQNKRVVVPAIGEKTSKEQTIAIVDAALHSASLASVPSDRDSRIVLVVPFSQAPKSSLPVVSAVEPIPAGDAVYTKLFRLKKTGGREVMAGLINLTTMPQCIQIFEASAVVAITDYASNLRRFDKIIAELEAAE